MQEVESLAGGDHRVTAEMKEPAGCLPDAKDVPGKAPATTTEMGIVPETARIADALRRGGERGRGGPAG